ncbi:hypothetical protein SAMN05421858_3587 [Haladaptatus litoreus]|uniref:Plastocyanin n=1 Tax=Haladaptatus litoreus TaxID=553468 RepID=A0A1N7DFU7_9EURY|nr:hypothetical protein [Haladaptatus litoreus]SIR74681.1 hypothetical protein SAMN05421858_3587 [Haladaptatus litoreus]
MPANRREFVRTVTGAAVGFITSLSGCLGSSPVKETNSIKITEDGFSPRNVKVDMKSSVTWENRGEKTHVIMSASSNWNFEVKIEPGQLTHHQFFSEGVYKVVDKEGGSAKDFKGIRMKIAVGDAKIQSPVK